MQTIENPISAWQLTQLTDGSKSGMGSVLSYFDLCPVSPDGTLLAFCSYPLGADWTAPRKEKWVGGMHRWPAGADSEARAHVCAMNLTSGEQQTLALLPVAESHNVFGLQWLPGTRTLAFMVPDFDNKSTTLHTVSVDTGVGESQQFGIKGAVMCPGFMIHPQRNLALVSVSTPFAEDKEDTTGVWTVDLDSGETRQLISLAAVIRATPELQLHSIDHLMLTHPKWSPDGQRLLFVVKNRGKPIHTKILFTLHADGSGLRHYAGKPAHMMWHPDSRSILNNGRDANKKPVLVTIHCDSGEETIIASPHPGSGGGSHPSYSPDVSQIVLEHFSPLSGTDGSLLCDLKLINPTNGKSDPLARFPLIRHAHDNIHVHPQWGPDSQTLYYNSDQTGRPEIYRLAGRADNARPAS